MEKQSKEDNKTTDASSLTDEALAIAEQMLKKGKDFHDEDLNEVTEEMVKNAEKEFLVNDKKKRKIEEIEKQRKEYEIVGEPDDYENYGKGLG